MDKDRKDTQESTQDIQGRSSGRDINRPMGNQPVDDTVDAVRYALEAAKRTMKPCSLALTLLEPDNRCPVCGFEAREHKNYEHDQELKQVPEVGLKFDGSKQRYDLIPADALEGMVRVITHGSEKYGPENWKKLFNAKQRYFAAMMRHVWAWKRGEREDQDSGMPHLWHVAANAFFLAQLEHEEND